MIVHIQPTQLLKGSIDLPASKSYSIRAHMIAGCGGTSRILHPSNCQDALAAKKAMNDLPKKDRIQVGESGTTLRFILPLAALQKRHITITGTGTLKGRPNQHLVEALKKMGVHIKGKGAVHSIPLVIEKGEPKAGTIPIDGSISSQFISGLLLLAPQLAGESVIQLKGRKLVSTDYIHMTLQLLKKAGIQVIEKDARTFVVPGDQTYKGLKDFVVPSDYGLAAFHMVAAALTQSQITLKGHLTDDLIQADGHILPILEKMGVSFEKTKRSIKMKQTQMIRGGRFSLKTCPDLLPVLAVLALFAKTKTQFYDVAHVRVKESDRITDLRKELEKVGAKVTEKKDELVVYPLKQVRQHQVLNPHQDHRLAMAFAVLGLKVGVLVKDMECCAKSYPDFLKDFRRLGARLSRA